MKWKMKAALAFLGAIYFSLYFHIARPKADLIADNEKLRLPNHCPNSPTFTSLKGSAKNSLFEIKNIIKNLNYVCHSIEQDCRVHGLSGCILSDILRIFEMVLSNQ